MTANIATLVATLRPSIPAIVKPPLRPQLLGFAVTLRGDQPLRDLRRCYSAATSVAASRHYSAAASIAAAASFIFPIGKIYSLISSIYIAAS